MEMLKMLKKIFAVLVLALAPALSHATPRGTLDEASAMADRAVAYYEANGIDALIAAVQDPENADFHDRDLYVFIGELDGPLVAHGVNPALVGKNLDGLKDTDGLLLFVAMKELATSEGDGWVDYKWTDPSTKKIAQKRSRIVRFGDNFYLGVGAYVE